jgi:protein phosphatase
MNSNYEFCLIGSYTDVGRVRKANEDYMDCFDTPNGKAVVVCDGMGGHVGGQIASQTAVTAIHDFLINKVFPDPREAIYHAITAANTAILNSTQAQPELSGMGSTCVMLIITPDGKVYYGHVGDSRIYIVANRKIRQLTTDHSYVQMLVDAGQITKEQAEHHPRKNEITNALGIPNMQPPTVCSEPIEPEAGNCFLLCSDGLTGMVDDTHIERVVSNRTLKIQQRAEKLVQMANEAGGVDNITVQLVEFALGAQDISGSKKEGKKSLKKLLLFIIPAVLILGGVAWWLLKPVPPNLDSDNTGTDTIQSSLIQVVVKSDTIISLSSKIELTETEQDVVLEDYLRSDDSLISVEPANACKEFIAVTKIGEKYIRLKPLKELKDKKRQIELVCETKFFKRCTIKIPVENNISKIEQGTLTTPATPDTISKSCVAKIVKNEKGKEELIATLIFDKNDSIRVDWLKKAPNQKMIETNIKTVRCDPVAVNNYQIIFSFTNGEIPKQDIVITGKKQNKKPVNIIVSVKTDDSTRTNL